MQDVVSSHEWEVRHRRGEHGGFVSEFRKRILGEEWVVIAEVKQHNCWLITGWKEEHES